jgi:hypothetical protein
MVRFWFYKPLPLSWQIRNRFSPQVQVTKKDGGGGDQKFFDFFLMQFSLMTMKKIVE